LNLLEVREKGFKSRKKTGKTGNFIHLKRRLKPERHIIKTGFKKQHLKF